MAERRMLSKTIIGSDPFIDMGPAAGMLYVHLNMNADDDGFINSPRKIQRMMGAADADLDELIARGFILRFESGVCVIKHWKMNNYIRNDRYKPTVYQEEYSLLRIKDNGAYTLDESYPPAGLKAPVYQMDTNGIPNGYQMETQDRIDKSKDRDKLDYIHNDAEHPLGHYKNVYLSTGEEERIRDFYQDADALFDRASRYLFDNPDKEYKRHGHYHLILKIAKEEGYKTK